MAREEFSIGIDIGGDEKYLFDPHYDSVHLYPRYGHAILRIITDKGQAQLHCAQVYGEHVAEEAGCNPVIDEEMGARAYDAYLRYQDSTVDESWLED